MVKLAALIKDIELNLDAVCTILEKSLHFTMYVRVTVQHMGPEAAANRVAGEYR